MEGFFRVRSSNVVGFGMLRTLGVWGLGVLGFCLRGLGVRGLGFWVLTS